MTKVEGVRFHLRGEGRSAGGGRDAVMRRRDTVMGRRKGTVMGRRRNTVWGGGNTVWGGGNTVWGGGNTVNGWIVESVSAKLAPWIYIFRLPVCVTYFGALHLFYADATRSDTPPHRVENRHILHVAVRSNHFKNSVIGLLAIDISTQPLHFYRAYTGNVCTSSFFAEMILFKLLSFNIMQGMHISL